MKCYRKISSEKFLVEFGYKIGKLKKKKCFEDDDF